VRLRFRSLLGKSVWWRILSLLVNAAVMVKGVVVRDRVSMRHGGTRESREELKVERNERQEEERESERVHL